MGYESAFGPSCYIRLSFRGHCLHRDFSCLKRATPEAMKIQDGPAIVALLAGMGLAFAANHAGKPLWFSLLTGFGVGGLTYISLVRLRFKRKDQ